MPGPIKPPEAAAYRAQSIPEEVYAAFNELIGRNYFNGCAQIFQDEVVALIILKFEAVGRKVERNEIFNNHWLDIEAAYRKAGWHVEYDKPGYNESYAANFKFREKR